MFGHYVGSSKRHVSGLISRRRRGSLSYQNTVAHKIPKLLVFAFVDFLFQNTQGHRLLDYVVVIGDDALVHAALEQSRRVVTTTAQTQLDRRANADTMTYSGSLWS